MLKYLPEIDHYDIWEYVDSMITLFWILHPICAHHPKSPRNEPRNLENNVERQKANDNIVQEFGDSGKSPT